MTHNALYIERIIENEAALKTEFYKLYFFGEEITKIAIKDPSMNRVEKEKLVVEHFREIEKKLDLSKSFKYVPRIRDEINKNWAGIDWEFLLLST